MNDALKPAQIYKCRTAVYYIARKPLFPPTADNNINEIAGYLRETVEKAIEENYPNAAHHVITYTAGKFVRSDTSPLKRVPAHLLSVLVQSNIEWEAREACALGVDTAKTILMFDTKFQLHNVELIRLG